MIAYKNLAYLERDFCHIKADNLDLRPQVSVEKPVMVQADDERPSRRAWMRASPKRDLGCGARSGRLGAARPMNHHPGGDVVLMVPATPVRAMPYGTD